MVILVFLAIVWAGVGVYWLKTRSSEGPTLGAAMTKRSALVLPLRGLGSAVDGLAPPGLKRSQVPPRVSAQPGHSLTQPATRSDPATRLSRTTTSDQARRRRRSLLLTLFAVAAATLGAAVTVGGTVLILAHLGADALLLGFILLLVQYQREIELDRTQNLPVYAEPRGNLAATGTYGR